MRVRWSRMSCEPRPRQDPSGGWRWLPVLVWPWPATRSRPSSRSFTRCANGSRAHERAQPGCPKLVQLIATDSPRCRDVGRCRLGNLQLMETPMTQTTNSPHLIYIVRRDASGKLVLVRVRVRHVADG